MSEIVMILLVVGGALVLIGARLWPRLQEKLPESEWTPAKQITSDYLLERDHRRGMYCVGGGLILLWCDVVLALNVAANSKAFLQQLQLKNSPFERAWEDSSDLKASCRNLCGDGNCGETQSPGICVGDSCPCDEDPASCPADCARTSVLLAECEQHCGDGVCALFTCIRPGCPCAESYKTCPNDCPPPPTKPNLSDEPENSYEDIDEEGVD